MDKNKYCYRCLNMYTVPIISLGVGMQTFLPCLEYSESARVLDNVRLNKQIIEAYQIYTGRVPQKNHPACLMWEGYKPHLLLYIVACLDEYEFRFGRVHTVRENIFGSNPHIYQACKLACDCVERPIHLRHNLVSISHMVNLIRKDGIYYGSRLTYQLRYATFVVFDREIDIDEFPTGYYWPVDCVGKKAQRDTQAWLDFLG